jgi:hypothetical protein
MQAGSCDYFSRKAFPSGNSSCCRLAEKTAGQQNNSGIQMFDPLIRNKRPYACKKKEEAIWVKCLIREQETETWQPALVLQKL